MTPTKEEVVATVAVPAVSTVRRPSERLLLAGALAGPVFVASAITQMLTHEGFDITRHPLSQLSTGSLGWVRGWPFRTRAATGSGLAS